jgi:hypothetical protein
MSEMCCRNKGIKHRVNNELGEVKNNGYEEQKYEGDVELV